MKVNVSKVPKSGHGEGDNYTHKWWMATTGQPPRPIQIATRKRQFAGHPLLNKCTKPTKMSTEVLLKRWYLAKQVGIAIKSTKNQVKPSQT